MRMSMSKMNRLEEACFGETFFGFKVLDKQWNALGDNVTSDATEKEGEVQLGSPEN